MQKGIWGHLNSKQLHFVSRKLGNLKAFVMWCSSKTFQPFHCFPRVASSLPWSGGISPRHGTHVLVASSDVTTTILALRGHAQDVRKW